MKKIAALALSLFLTYGTAFADTPKDTPKDADAQPAKPATPAKPKAATKTDKSDSAIAAEIEELRQALQAQQEQLSLLKEELAKRDRQIDEARDAAAAANARAAEATTKATEAVNTTAAVKSTADTLNTKVADLSASNEALKTTVATSTAQADKAPEEGPASISYKGIKITPGGFVEAATATRTHATGDDINTQFTGIPYPNSALSRLSENVFSARQSRLSLLLESNVGSAKVTGYVETDFLGTGVTSNNRQSNSYVMRQRQIWGQAAFSNGITITGGQMWSLATETRKGLDNRTEAPPLTVDSQYNVGFTWARQYGFRVVKNFNDKAWVGFSVEDPQVTLTNHNSPTPFLVGGLGAGGGLLNFADTTGYSANYTPDFVVKAAAEPGRGHYEVFGVISTFRAQVYPCGAPIAQVALPTGCPGTAPSAANVFNDTRTGGGIGVNLRAPVDPGKKLDVGVHFFGGDGVGRYSSAQLADVTVRPNGTLALIRGGSALGTLEFHPNPKLDVYFNYGIEYAYRTAYTYTNAAGATVAVGYGSPLFNESGCEAAPPLPTGAGPFAGTTAPAGFNPSSAAGCTGDIRTIQEGTLGFWHKLYNGPKGSLRWGIQYSYIFKNTWSGNNNNTPVGNPGVTGKAIDNMIFTSFRYYIP